MLPFSLEQHSNSRSLYMHSSCPFSFWQNSNQSHMFLLPNTDNVRDHNGSSRYDDCNPSDSHSTLVLSARPDVLLLRDTTVFLCRAIDVSATIATTRTRGPPAAAAAAAVTAPAQPVNEETAVEPTTNTAKQIVPPSPRWCRLGRS